MKFTAASTRSRALSSPFSASSLSSITNPTALAGSCSKTCPGGLERLAALALYLCPWFATAEHTCQTGMRMQTYIILHVLVAASTHVVFFCICHCKLILRLLHRLLRGLGLGLRLIAVYLRRSWGNCARLLLLLLTRVLIQSYMLQVWFLLLEHGWRTRLLLILESGLVLDRRLAAGRLDILLRSTFGLFLIHFN